MIIIKGGAGSSLSQSVPHISNIFPASLYDFAFIENQNTFHLCQTGSKYSVSTTFRLKNSNTKQAIYRKLPQ